MKLDRIIDGTRYRSTTRIALDSTERHGVRDVALWLCREVAVLERYSIWDDGEGRNIGTTYRVLDPRDSHNYGDHTFTGAEARDMLQEFADQFSGYTEEDTILELARRHAPAEVAG